MGVAPLVLRSEFLLSQACFPIFYLFSECDSLKKLVAWGPCPEIYFLLERRDLDLCRTVVWN